MKIYEKVNEYLGNNECNNNMELLHRTMNLSILPNELKHNTIIRIKKDDAKDFFQFLFSELCFELIVEVVKKIQPIVKKSETHTIGEWIYELRHAKNVTGSERLDEIVEFLTLLDQ